jgi:hypothetical protein
MNDANAPLSPPATAAVTELAGRVTGDPVDRQELVDHLTDAVLDYATGRRRPSEADALLLVERHLGDPDGLAAQLAAAHGRPAGGFWRRLAAAAVATCSAVVVMRLAEAGWAWRTKSGQFSVFTVQDADVAWWLADGVVPVVVGGLLLWWRRTERAGGRPWYVRRPGWAVGLIFAVATGVQFATPILIEAAVSPHVFTGVVHAVPASAVMSWAIIGLSAACYLSTAWMWAAFVNRGAARRSDTAWVLAGWAALWGLTASLYVVPVYSPAAYDYVLRPQVAVLPGFETELTWAGIAIGGLCVLVARGAVMAVMNRFHSAAAAQR